MEQSHTLAIRESFSTFREYIDAFPDDRDGPRYMGHSYLMLDKDPAGAIPWLEKADALTPAFFPTVEKLVYAHVQLGDLERGRALLQDYLQRPGIAEYGRNSAEKMLNELAAA